MSFKNYKYIYNSLSKMSYKCSLFPLSAGHCESMWYGVPGAHHPGLATNRQVLDRILWRGDAAGEW